MIDTLIDTPVAENWLTYRGNQSESLGRLMGPDTFGQVHTVVAVEFDPDFAWPDGELGRTRLGMVTGDQRSGEEREIADQAIEAQQLAVFNAYKAGFV